MSFAYSSVSSSEAELFAYIPSKIDFDPSYNNKFYKDYIPKDDRIYNCCRKFQQLLLNPHGNKITQDDVPNQDDDYQLPHPDDYAVHTKANCNELDEDSVLNLSFETEGGGMGDCQDKRSTPLDHTVDDKINEYAVALLDFLMEASSLTVPEYKGSYFFAVRHNTDTKL